LALEKKVIKQLDSLGHRLWLFLKACNHVYFRSVKGVLPPWIAAYADAGKPEWLIEAARATPLREVLPRVIRPDLLLTEEGVALTEIDSVPGGIGLTAWLHRVYADAPGLVGGARAMTEGFASIFSTPGVDLVISKEAGSYRPEMEWLAQQAVGRDYAVQAAERYEGVPEREVYRFFELFDLPNVPGATAQVKKAAAGTLRMTAPPKPWLEEKLWLALLRSRPLREVWRRELSDNHLQQMEAVAPYSWIVDPSPLPHHAALPRLDAQSWDEVAAFSQKERQLVLKRSGFHEEAWGARSVTIGHDVSQPEWAAALAEAQREYPAHPYVMQEFKSARVIEHPYYDPTTGVVKIMRGRARLCPYYFVSAEDQKISLGGILATICPEDKKILHGMRDAILVPCAKAE
jgi:hypothetical protein